MGRYAGWIALHAAIAGGAEVCLIPEIPYDIEKVVKKLNSRFNKGKVNAIVVIAEGAIPKGGNPPYYGNTPDDKVNERFLADEYYQNKIQNTMRPSEVNPDEYVGIFYAGGHGTMWDFPDNEKLAVIAQKIYEKNGIVSAVCHGPAGLVNIKLSNGKYLVDGKKNQCFHQ